MSMHAAEVGSASFTRGLLGAEGRAPWRPSPSFPNGDPPPIPPRCRLGLADPIGPAPDWEATVTPSAHCMRSLLPRCGAALIPARLLPSALPRCVGGTPRSSGRATLTPHQRHNTLSHAISMVGVIPAKVHIELPMRPRSVGRPSPANTPNQPSPHPPSRDSSHRLARCRGRTTRI